MSVVPVIMCVDVLNTDPRRPSVGKRRGLGFNASIPVIMINDKRGVVSGLMTGRREHFVGTRHKFVEGW